MSPFGYNPKAAQTRRSKGAIAEKGFEEKILLKYTNVAFDPSMDGYSTVEVLVGGLDGVELDHIMWGEVQNTLLLIFFWVYNNFTIFVIGIHLYLYLCN